MLRAWQCRGLDNNNTNNNHNNSNNNNNNNNNNKNNNSNNSNNNNNNNENIVIIRMRLAGVSCYTYNKLRAWKICGSCATREVSKSKFKNPHALRCNRLGQRLGHGACLGKDQSGIHRHP